MAAGHQISLLSVHSHNLLRSLVTNHQSGAHHEKVLQSSRYTNLQEGGAGGKGQHGLQVPSQRDDEVHGVPGLHPHPHLQSIVLQ